MIFQAVEKDVKLKMWERTLMPESTMVEKEGKKIFVKTGKDVEMTTYVFTDITGDKLVLLSKDNSFRTLEGEEVIISLKIEYNDFSKKNRVSLNSITRV